MDHDVSFVVFDFLPSPFGAMQKHKVGLTHMTIWTGR
jgi:hypothetical protein